MTTTNVCSIKECTKPVHGRGWCEMHYGRWYRRGSPHIRTKGLPHRTLVEWVMSRERGEECWLWPFTLNEDGYGLVYTKDGKSSAHRMAYTLAYGAPEHCVCHRCDVRNCINPAHLFDAPHLDNMRDAHQKKRIPSVLSDDDVRQIRVDNRPHKAIAAEFGCSVGYVSDIKTGKSRGYLDGFAPWPRRSPIQGGESE